MADSVFEECKSLKPGACIQVLMTKSQGWYAVVRIVENHYDSKQLEISTGILNKTEIVNYSDVESMIYQTK